ncbi:hypothetical protein [Paenibacillus amylolyticus]|uniref:Uncharacterized protein n=1 Tax=Paenibacillus amylolyticus TaxID=1451 RepID=A0ABD8B261_PAEAM
MLTWIAMQFVVYPNFTAPTVGPELITRLRGGRLNRNSHRLSV